MSDPADAPRNLDNIHRVLETRLERAMGSLPGIQCPAVLGLDGSTLPKNPAREPEKPRGITPVQTRPRPACRETDNVYPFAQVPSSRLRACFSCEGVHEMRCAILKLASEPSMGPDRVPFSRDPRDYRAKSVGSPTPTGPISRREKFEGGQEQVDGLGFAGEDPVIPEEGLAVGASWVLRLREPCGFQDAWSGQVQEGGGPIGSFVGPLSGCECESCRPADWR